MSLIIVMAFALASVGLPAYAKADTLVPPLASGSGEYNNTQKTSLKGIFANEHAFDKKRQPLVLKTDFVTAENNVDSASIWWLRQSRQWFKSLKESMLQKDQRRYASILRIIRDADGKIKFNPAQRAIIEEEFDWFMNRLFGSYCEEDRLRLRNEILADVMPMRMSEFLKFLPQDIGALTDEELTDVMRSLDHITKSFYYLIVEPKTDRVCLYLNTLLKDEILRIRLVLGMMQYLKLKGIFKDDGLYEAATGVLFILRRNERLLDSSILDSAYRQAAGIGQAQPSQKKSQQIRALLQGIAEKDLHPYVLASFLEGVSRRDEHLTNVWTYIGLMLLGEPLEMIESKAIELNKRTKEEEKIKDLKSRAASALVQGKYEMALRFYNLVLASSPFDREALNGRAKALSGLEQNLQERWSVMMADPAQVLPQEVLPGEKLSHTSFGPMQFLRHTIASFWKKPVKQGAEGDNKYLEALDGRSIAEAIQSTDPGQTIFLLGFTPARGFEDLKVAEVTALGADRSIRRVICEDKGGNKRQIYILDPHICSEFGMTLTKISLILKQFEGIDFEGAAYYCRDYKTEVVDVIMARAVLGGFIKAGQEALLAQLVSHYSLYSNMDEDKLSQLVGISGLDKGKELLVTKIFHTLRWLINEMVLNQGRQKDLLDNISLLLRDIDRFMHIYRWAFREFRTQKNAVRKMLKEGRVKFQDRFCIIESKRHINHVAIYEALDELESKDKRFGLVDVVLLSVEKNGKKKITLSFRPTKYEEGKLLLRGKIIEEEVKQRLAAMQAVSGEAKAKVEAEVRNSIRTDPKRFLSMESVLPVDEILKIAEKELIKQKANYEYLLFLDRRLGEVHVLDTNIPSMPMVIIADHHSENALNGPTATSVVAQMTIAGGIGLEELSKRPVDIIFCPKEEMLEQATRYANNYLLNWPDKDEPVLCMIDHIDHDSVNSLLITKYPQVLARHAGLISEVSRYGDTLKGCFLTDVQHPIAQKPQPVNFVSPLVQKLYMIEEILICEALKDCRTPMDWQAAAGRLVEDMKGILDRLETDHDYLDTERFDKYFRVYKERQVQSFVLAKKILGKEYDNIEDVLAKKAAQGYFTMDVSGQKVMIVNERSENLQGIKAFYEYMAYKWIEEKKGPIPSIVVFCHRHQERFRVDMPLGKEWAELDYIAMEQLRSRLLPGATLADTIRPRKILMAQKDGQEIYAAQRRRPEEFDYYDKHGFPIQSPNLSDLRFKELSLSQICELKERIKGPLKDLLQVRQVYCRNIADRAFYRVEKRQEEQKKDRYLYYDDMGRPCEKPKDNEQQLEQTGVFALGSKVKVFCNPVLYDAGGEIRFDIKDIIEALNEKELKKRVERLDDEKLQRLSPTFYGTARETVIKWREERLPVIQEYLAIKNWGGNSGAVGSPKGEAMTILPIAPEFLECILGYTIIENPDNESLRQWAGFMRDRFEGFEKFLEEKKSEEEEKKAQRKRIRKGVHTYLAASAVPKGLVVQCTGYINQILNKPEGYCTREALEEIFAELPGDVKEAAINEVMRIYGEHTVMAELEEFMKFDGRNSPDKPARQAVADVKMPKAIAAQP